MLTTVVMVAVVVLGAPTAGAQYGGGPNLFVDPAVIELCETGDPATFDAFGNAFAPSSTVTLTVDGIPGVLATTTTTAAGIFSFDDVTVPPAFAAGNDYTLRASSGGDSATSVVTVVADTSESCGGSLASTTTTSSVPGGSSTTSSVPGGSSTTSSVPGGGIDGGGIDGGGTPGPSGGNDGLAITGLTRLEISLQIAMTLVGAGFVLALLARRRRDAAA